MHPANRPNLHRKFIAFVLATSLAITGFAAAPARASEEDLGKVLAGLAALAILGVAINKSRHRNRETVTKHPQPTYPHPIPYPSPKPLPPEIARYDLPSKCLRYFPTYKNGRKLIGQRCLRNTYAHVQTLPQQCRVRFWTGQRNKIAYKPRCLRKRGYRIVGY